MEPEMQPLPPSLIVDEQVRDHLLNTAKWAKFLAIVGFVFTALIVIAAFTMGSMMSMLPQQNAFMRMGGGIGITILYLIFAVLYFIPCLYLFRFATRTQRALSQNIQESFLTSLASLRRFFRFVGVLTLIYLIIIALAFIAAMIGGAVGAM